MRVLTFGEILLRLSSPGYTRLFQKDCFETSFCGGEANVAASLAILGMEAEFVTKLPHNDLGKAAANSLRYFGVRTDRIKYGGGRLGLYYLEKGASQRPSKVIYDRQYSAISLADPDDFDWDSIFEGINWFHWTGITPALSDSLVTICMRACEAARRKGITISCDLNYRKNLWSSEKANAVMSRLMPYVDVCVANEEDVEKVLGIVPDKSDFEHGIINRKGYTSIAEQISDRYGCSVVAITLRKSFSASCNGWSGILYSAKANQTFLSRDYDIQIVDRVGAGDSFTAGLIYSLMKNKGWQEAVDFAAAASCLKHSIEGDYNRITVEEIENLLQNGGNGRVQR